MSIQFDQPVKYLGHEERKGEKNGKPWVMVEAMLFVPELGRIKVPVKQGAHLPEPGQSIRLSLSVDQGKFQAMQVQWDTASSFKVAA